MILGEQFFTALDLAARLHARQFRKGGRIPYVSHLLSVTAIVLEYGGSEIQAVAALLHDAVEDQGGVETLQLIRDRFGERIAELVVALSDTDEHPKPSWLERKQRHLDRLLHAPVDCFLILGADKLHNLRATLREYRRVGSEVWSRFGGGRDGALWYYRQMANIVAARLPDELAAEIYETLSDLERLVDEQEGKPSGEA